MLKSQELKDSHKSKKLRDSARNQACVMCLDDSPGLVVLAHRNIPGFFGTGMKGPDWWSAELCYKCHEYGDNEGRKDYQWWERAVFLTTRRRIMRGLVEVA